MSSIDFSVTSARKSTIENLLQHPSNSNPPARLQHSPSLPNIWFPPHCGPIPPEIESSSQRTPTGPMPDSADNISTSSFTVGRDRLSMDISEIKNEDSTTSPDSFVKSMPALYAKKFTNRQRADRQRTNSLLTPPLTPSSSIKSTQSTTSYDSDTHPGSTAALPTQESDEDDEYECARFIEVKNVAKLVSTGYIRDTFVEALSEYPIQNVLGDSESGFVNRGPRPGEVLKGVFIKGKETHGIIILAFYDVRWANAALKTFMNPKTTILKECLGDDVTDEGTRCWFTCRFLRMEELVQITGSSSFVAPVDGGFDLSVTRKSANDSNTSEAEAIVLEVRKILLAFGDIWTLRPTKNTKETDEILFRVEYYDYRDAEVAYTSLNDQSWPGFKFRAYGRHSHPLASAAATSETAVNHAPGPYTLPAIERSQSRPKLTPVIVSQHHNTSVPKAEDGPVTPTATSFPRHPISDIPTSSSPTYFYTSLPHAPPLEARPDSGNAENRTNESAADGDPHYGQEQVQCYTRMQGCRYCPSRNSAVAEYSPYYHSHGHPTPLPSIYFQHLQPLAEPFPTSTQGASYSDVPLQGIPLETISSPWMYGIGSQAALPASPTGHYWYAAEGQTAFVNNPYVARITSPEGPGMSYYTISEMQGPMYVDSTATTRGLYCSGTVSASTASAPTPGSTPVHPNGSPPGTIQERNQLNLSRIEEGLDTRTTVMIKNIPNKMTDKDLITYIGNVCPRKIDFLYLRMDFQNGCNVGYAFVNFIQVEDLLVFAKQRLGQKWNMFSSEKVLQMSYANYQGKEALVEKFKNSCIMDEREEWRPKIFYSSGPNIGMPEPFPPPTHLRRKERSSFNRGALYVPGVTQDSQVLRGRLGLASSPPRPPSRYLERQPARIRDIRQVNDRTGGNQNRSSVV
ncbi:RNA recognition motif 2-domain-containing protein [Cyathus striatus]|nr:RNA recognition motif 2-domain-containing protein [Cyathus striatus]